MCPDSIFHFKSGIHTRIIERYIKKTKTGMQRRGHKTSYKQTNERMKAYET